MINEVLQGDSLELMKSIPDGSVDCVLTDPPYHVLNKGKGKSEWDSIIDLEKMWEQFLRIGKANCPFIFTCNQPFTTKLIASKMELWKAELIWVKNCPTGFLNSKRAPLRNHESLQIFYRSQPTYNPQMTIAKTPVKKYTRKTEGKCYGGQQAGFIGGESGTYERFPVSVLSFDVVPNNSTDRFHNTQKPISLFENMIKTYSLEGNVILDPFAGAFTTAVAANNTNRKWICIEKEEKFCLAGKERIEKHKNNIV